MISDEIKRELDRLPDQVLVNYISDSVAKMPGMTMSTFAIGMKFTTLDPLEFFDYAMARLRVQFVATLEKRP